MAGMAYQGVPDEKPALYKHDAESDHLERNSVALNNMKALDTVRSSDVLAMVQPDVSLQAQPFLGVYGKVCTYLSCECRSPSVHAGV